jgi:hypothetical protein
MTAIFAFLVGWHAAALDMKRQKNSGIQIFDEVFIIQKLI